MKLITTISDQELPADISHFILREASRAILFDNNNRIPLLFVAKHHYHKLPGGGIDDGENRKDTLIRECREEIGAEIEVIGEVGKIVEHRCKLNFTQNSYCYYGNIVSKGEPDFTDSEIARGFHITWHTLTDAITLLEQESPQDYTGVIIVQRDLAFLKETANILNKRS